MLGLFKVVKLRALPTYRLVSDTRWYKKYSVLIEDGAEKDAWGDLY